MTSNIFFPVNAKILPTAFVIRLILKLNSRQAFILMQCRLMSNEAEAVPVLCKPIEAKLSDRPHQVGLQLAHQ